MPIGDVVGEIVGQLVMEAGGEAIQRKFGWVGCVTVMALIIGGIALLFWLIQ